MKFITLYKKTIEDKSTEYKHKIKDGNTKWIEIVNREKNLEAFIEWTLQQIENNFEWENKIR
ncbi:type II toxin-antitoxin system antitoxin, TscA family [Staphylococcus epidermidis]|uniref:TscA family type II toxin-antitoxin system antitoxin n=1 Tax=Staphylococcus epidermidis TaxID=1282 RepID=UPI003F490C8F